MVQALAQQGELLVQTLQSPDGSRCEARADRRLLTDRWLNDERSGQVDANGDPNVSSFYRRSRYDLLTAGEASLTKRSLASKP